MLPILPPKTDILGPPGEPHLQNVHTPSWWRAWQPWGLLAFGSMHSGLCSICLPSRCTRLSTSPSWPWPTSHAVCSIFAAVPFGNYLAKSAFTLCPCYPCQSPCKITSFWNQRVFCTENQSVGTEAVVSTTALSGGRMLRTAPRGRGQTRVALPMSPPCGCTGLPELHAHLEMEWVLKGLSASQGCL